MVDFFLGQIKPEFLAMGAGYSGIKYVANSPDVKEERLRVRHDITGTIGRDDFGASLGAKSAHTGSMEAMSHAGAAQKRPGPTGRPIFGPGRRCSSVTSSRNVPSSRAAPPRAPNLGLPMASGILWPTLSCWNY